MKKNIYYIVSSLFCTIPYLITYVIDHTKYHNLRVVSLKLKTEEDINTLHRFTLYNTILYLITSLIVQNNLHT